MSQATDEIKEELKIIRRAQQYPEAFGLLYEKYFQSIYLFVYKRIEPKEVTGDLVSQVFLKALTHLPKYEYRGVPFSAWLYRIATNQVNEYFRKAKQPRALSLGPQHAQTLFEEVIDSEASISEPMELLISLLEQLTPDEVALLELRFFEERPFKEVAYILGLTESNAKVKVHRLLTKMRNMIA